MILDVFVYATVQKYLSCYSSAQNLSITHILAQDISEVPHNLILNFQSILNFYSHSKIHSSFFNKLSLPLFLELNNHACLRMKLLSLCCLAQFSSSFKILLKCLCLCLTFHGYYIYIRIHICCILAYSYTHIFIIATSSLKF